MSLLSRCCKAWLVAALIAHGAGRPALAITSPAEPPGEWLDDVSHDIAASEYHLSRRDGLPGWTAPNRRHGIRVTFSEGAVEIRPRTDEDGWRLRLELRGVSRDGGPPRLADRVTAEDVNEGHLEWSRGAGITEWYRNDARGLEQGLSLAQPPAGPAGNLVVIDYALAGALAEPTRDGAAVLLRAPSGRDALAIRDLVVRDATGRALPACLDVATASLLMRIDDGGASYPLAVDPVISAPEWTGESDQPTSGFGFSVATAGDVNGDGYSDVVVGARQFDDGSSNEGRAYLFLGSPSGPSPSAAWAFENDVATSELGTSVATAGDVNGDGFSDVIVGAPLFDDGVADLGRAYVFLGSRNGPSLTPDWTATGNTPSAKLGTSVASAGDVDGDGFDEVVVGAPGYLNGQSNEGSASLFKGSAAGLAASASWFIEGDQQGAALGSSVGTAGDVDGDGFADVVIGAPTYMGNQPFEGRVLVFLGSAAGLPTVPSWTADGGQSFGTFGNSVSTAGDVNGDGFSDVIIGAAAFDGSGDDDGRVFVYAGSAAGLSSTPLWTMDGVQNQATFGNSVSTAGDVNGDGFADVVIGAFQYDDGETSEGRAFIFEGSPSGPGSTPVLTFDGNQANANLGFSVAGAGDVDGDGFSDVIIGAYRYDNVEANEGRAWVLRGSAAGLSTLPVWSVGGDQDDAQLSYSLAAAGDVDGDGYGDVVVGVPFYDDGQLDEGEAWLFRGSAAGLETTPSWRAQVDQAAGHFGAAVSSAGDVDGDGYSDVLVAAPALSTAYLYRGTPTGLEAAPAWTTVGDAVGSDFGDCLASAGDVNGDGYSDVIVGAPLHANGENAEGAAFVYLGSATGLSATSAWSVESDQADAQLGRAVATAGDVNRDGYSDVVVGAPLFDSGFTDAGRAWVFLGSRTGPTTAGAFFLSGSQDQGRLGASVATAGDVNGDGYSDVLFGSPGYSNGQPGEGSAWLYLGTPAGPVASNWWVEGEQDLAALGESVASAGDVNGDGYSDVLVGARLLDGAQTDEGRAFMYLGSPSGLADAAAWTADGGQAAGEFGARVAAAGDVNGDGFGDALVGAPHVADIELNEGRATLFYGNGGGGLSRIPRQARADDSAPIDVLGRALATDGFRLKADGRSPFGRQDVRLEWEVRSLALPFNGQGLGISAFLDTGVPGARGSVVPFDELQGQLPGGGVLHWRVRLRSQGVFPWQSRWMSLPQNAITETDLRIIGGQVDLLRNADLTALAFPPYLTVLTARRDPVLDATRDLEQADVGALSEIRLTGDAATVGNGNPGVIIFYEATNTLGVLRVRKDQADVVVSGW